MANKNIDNKPFIDKTIAVILFLAAAIVPLIVRLRQVPVGKYEYGIIRANNVINDMFSYNKAVAICVLAVITLVYLGAGVIFEEKRLKLKLKSIPCYTLYTYIGLCLISSIFSKHSLLGYKRKIRRLFCTA